MNKTPQNPEPIRDCGACAEWHPRDHADMSYYGECTHRAVGHYTADSTLCVFTPSKWKKK